jgi:hypothetical protein
VDTLGEGVQGDTAMLLKGLYAKPDGGLGEFGATVLNVDKSQGNNGRSYATIVPGTYKNWFDPNAYVLSDWRWSDGDLQAGKTKLVLLTDSAFAAECTQSGTNGLSLDSATRVITSAANTWDAATNANLFPDANTVTTVPSGVWADTKDGKNVHAWKSMSGALAYSRTYVTKTKSVQAPDGVSYKSVLESDVCYNKNLRWTTNFGDSRLYHWDTNAQKYVGDTYYLETVAAHELGHTLGLLDTYLHSTYKYDQSQIMGYYNDVNDLDGTYNGDVDLGP